MTAKEELELHKEVFEKLRPFIVLAMNDYYFEQDKEKIKQKLKELGYEYHDG